MCQRDMRIRYPQPPVLHSQDANPAGEELRPMATQLSEMFRSKDGGIRGALQVAVSCFPAQALIKVAREGAKLGKAFAMQGPQKAQQTVAQLL